MGARARAAVAGLGAARVARWGGGQVRAEVLGAAVQRGARRGQETGVLLQSRPEGERERDSDSYVHHFVLKISEDECFFYG